MAQQGGRTPLSPGEATRLLEGAWQRVTGSAPSEGTLSTLWAQWALETGRGRSMHGYNFGGIKATPGAAHPSAVLTTREGFGDTERSIRSRFRTYATAEAGAIDYIETLHRQYPEAAAAAGRGDVQGFVAGLTQRGYFTADPAVYGRALHSLSAEHAQGGGGDFSRLQDPGPLVDALLRTLGQAIARHHG